MNTCDRGDGKEAEARVVPLALKAHGFTLSLDLVAPSTAAYHNPLFLGSATLSPTVPTGTWVARTTLDASLADVDRLCAWIGEHIAALSERRYHESRTWVSQYLDMSVQCLLGDIVRQEDILEGDFTIRIMLRVGRDATGARVYAGLEGVIDVQEALLLCDSMRAYVGGWTEARSPRRATNGPERG